MYDIMDSMKNKQDYDTFINLLCIECGIIDNSTVSMVYNGLIRLIIKELIAKKIIVLPEIGTFKKGTNYKSSIVQYNINQGTKENSLSKSRLNFRINQKLRLLTKDFLD